MLKALLLSTSVAFAAAQPPPMTLISFSDGDNGYTWEAKNDPVMGGMFEQYSIHYFEVILALNNVTRCFEFQLYYRI